MLSEWPEMGFFDGEEGDAARGQEDALKRIAGGGIPSRAEARLRELAGDSMFSSTLGVGEFALLAELECVPLGQVLGASVHQVGWQYLAAEAQWGVEVFRELDLVTRAWDQARSRAFARLSEEAALLGADAVVGVRLRRGEHDWARSTVDYVVNGTAIREPAARTAPQPVLSDLSGQEYWKLRCAGWAPAALVAATTVFFVSQTAAARWRRRLSTARNQEVNEFTRAFAQARLTTVHSLYRQARTAEATGVVGVRLDHQVRHAKVKVATQPGRQRTGLSVTSLAMGAEVPTEGQDTREGLMITIHAVGTAISRLPSGTPAAPELSLRLGARA